jgi:D-glycero-alpha-D-manno-heptose-7-phosphate kinase
VDGWTIRNAIVGKGSATMKTIRDLLGQESVEASAPCRIDMGGTLDLSTFYLPLHHLGPCTFNIALNLRTRVCISSFEAGRLRISSHGFDDLTVDAGSAPFDHPLGLMAAVAAHFQANGVQVEIASSSPPRSALGGSSVAAVAMIWAFSKIRARAGLPMPKRSAVALLAHAIEQSVAGVPCGLQDQLAAVYGGVNAWYWTGDPEGIPFERVALIEEDAFPDLSEDLLVAYCGAPHVSKDVNATWVRQFVSGKTRQQWRQIVRLSRGFSEAMRQMDFPAARAFMNQETEIRCRLTPEVLDAVGQPLVAAAIRGGCGARFTGAGGGGCVWAFGDPGQLAALRPEWESVLAHHQSAGILEARIEKRGLL